MAELHWEPSVNAAEVGVSAKDGVITLTGFVESYAEKLAARDTASRVFGVKAIADSLRCAYPITTNGQTKISAARRRMRLPGV
jgi:osmotically-inducible protein OsmY